MAIWWITALGFLLCLGFIGGIFVYGLKGALHSEDSNYIDPLPKEED
ncbi:MAG TPA: hypothetical protein VK190_00605 [Pseudoneobacillus sp.]|nr:hypothetical protein [Pseudoneobacillus sp.]